MQGMVSCKVSRIKIVKKLSIEKNEFRGESIVITLCKSV